MFRDVHPAAVWVVRAGIRVHRLSGRPVDGLASPARAEILAQVVVRGWPEAGLHAGFGAWAARGRP